MQQMPQAAATPSPGVADAGCTAQANAVASRVIAAALFAGGAQHVVLSPGSRSTPLVLAFDVVAPAASVHVVLDERAAAFVALGLARASGQPAIVVCTSGSAGAHHLPAVIEASYSCVPLIVLTADRPPEAHACGAAQTIEQRRLFAEHVRAVFELPVPDADIRVDWLRGVAAQAIERATGAEPGPVHINAPLREPLWSPGVDGGDGGDRLWTPPGAAPSSGPSGSVTAVRRLRGELALSDQAICALADRVGAARRGVIVAGPRGFDGRAAHQRGRGAFAPAVFALARRLGWPVLAEPAAQLRCGWRSEPSCIETADLMLRSAELAAALQPDLVLAIGAPPTSKAVQQWLGRVGGGRVLHLGSTSRWQDPMALAAWRVIADEALTCGALAERLATTATATATCESWLAAWRQADRSVRDAVASPMAIGDNGALGDGCWEGDVVAAVMAELPAGAALHVANSMSVRDFDTFGWSAVPSDDHAVAVFSSRGVNGIDGTIATAAGEALAWGAAPTCVVTGDLAFWHDIGGLRAAVELGARLTVVVVDNAGGAIFAGLPIAEHRAAYERYFRTPQTTAQIAAVARACGARAVRVQDAASLRAAFRGELAHDDGIGVIEVKVAAGPAADRRRRVLEAASRAAGRAALEIERVAAGRTSS